MPTHGIHRQLLSMTLAAALASTLTACASASGGGAAGTTPAPDSPPPQDAPMCRHDAASRWVGATLTDAIQEDARKATGAATVRAIGPDDMVTMDFREDRLNIRVDAQRKILSFDCG